MIIDKNKYNILVVEDNPGDYVLVEEFLQKKMQSPIISQAIDFREAVYILAGDKRFDIILLDLSLPDRSGKLLITEMVALADPTPIIVLTGYGDIEFSIQSVSLGVSDYLLKDDLTDTMLYKSIIYAIERRKRVLQMRESEKRYSDLFHLSPQPMWLYSLDSLQYLDVNEAAIVHYGYTRQEFLSMTIRDIRPPEDLLIMEKAVEKIRKDNDCFSRGIYRHTKKSGEVISVEMRGNVIYYKDQKAEVVVINDITERVNYINAVESQNLQLREIAWLQSHVVRAPVARMKGIINLIKDNKLGVDEHHTFLEHLFSSADELDDIIKDITNRTQVVKMKLF